MPCVARSNHAAFLGVLLALSACAPMRDIDRRVDRVVSDQTAALAGGAVAPAGRHQRPQSPPRASYEKAPASTNPDAADLDYTGAPDDRDVLARLDSYSEDQPSARAMGLEDILRVSQASAREYRTAEEDYLLAAINLLIERHRWGPRFFDDISASISADQDRGDFDTALTVMNELRATQRLPYGGEIEARLVTAAAHQLAEIVGERTTDSSSLVLAAEVPLLRGAGLVAQEDLIQAERNVVYAARDFETFRRRFFVDIASDYFALVAQQSAIRNQEMRLRSVMKFFEQTRALVEAGRQPPFQARNVEQNVLTSRNDLINSREAYILNLDRFKVRLGLPVEAPVRILPMSLDLRDPDVSVAQAAEAALLYRLDYQNERDRVDDAKRRVEVARNQILPDLDVAGSVAFGGDPDDPNTGVTFSRDETDYRGAITFGLPLDREIERLGLRRALIELEQQKRSLDQFRDTTVLEARQSVREIDRARFSVRLQEQAVRINEMRLEEIQIKRAEVDPQTRLDAENELLDSRNQRDAAVRDLRIAILEYLVRTGQLRVGPGGEFRPLRGMDLRVIDEAPAEAPAGPATAPDASPPAEPAATP
jgi:outer membrane protein TolC